MFIGKIKRESSPPSLKQLSFGLKSFLVGDHLHSHCWRAVINVSSIEPVCEASNIIIVFPSS